MPKRHYSNPKPGALGRWLSYFDEDKNKVSTNGGNGGGGIEPMAPGDVPYDDATFDARTQVRMKPSSYDADKASGWQHSAKANAWNEKQQLDYLTQQQELVNKPLLETAIADARIGATQRGEQNQFNTAVKRRAVANALADLDGTGTINEDEIGTLAPEYLDIAKQEISNLGNQTSMEGFEGVRSTIDARDATTDHTRTLTRLANEKPVVEGKIQPGWKSVGDGSFISDDGSVLRKWVESTDLEGKKSGKFVTFDMLNGGAEIVMKPKTATVATPPSVSNAVKPVVLDNPYSTTSQFLEGQKEKFAPVSNAVKGTMDYLRRYGGKRDGESWNEYYKRTGNPAYNQ